MEATISARVKRAWNAFLNRDPTDNYKESSIGATYRPDRPRLSRGNEKTIMASIINRIAIDVAAITFQHCRLDENNRFKEEIISGLNDCLTLEANIDQSHRDFIQDIVESMLYEGHAVILPTWTIDKPKSPNSIDILEMRVGKVVAWYPDKVKVNAYNDLTGKREDIVISKRKVGIVYNPLYSVMNEPNSTLQRLIRKLALLDSVDEQSSSGKLDLIIQLPYTVRTESRKNEANKRRQDIEKQLTGSKYGIAYIDGTEKVTQLNRSLENNLLKQIEYLTSMLYSQLGITQAVMDGTADEKTMLNYNNRITEPIASSITNEMRRKFLTKTARTQKQTILFFRDPFKLVPINDMAEISDKFTRNEIASSNEIRQVIGWKPSSDPKADQLVNSNIAQPTGVTNPAAGQKPGATGQKSPEDAGEDIDVEAVLNTLTDEQKEAVNIVIEQLTNNA